MRRSGVCLLLLALLCAGCATNPRRGAGLWSAEASGVRELQTRRFDGIDETELLAACTALLQDLGFNIRQSEAELGLIVATKERPADVAPGTAMLRLLEAILLDEDLVLDERQSIRASLVTIPEQGRERSFRVRVTFQRTVWNTENAVSRQEPLDSPELYRRFFEQLSKSVFLEAEAI